MNSHNSTSAMPFNDLHKGKSYDPANHGNLPSVIFLSVLMPVGAIANLHVFIVYVIEFKKKSTYSTFVLALATIDTLVCVLQLPWEILDLQYPYNFFSTGACKFFKTQNAVLALSSMSLLVFIAIDRYKHICHPLRVQWSVSTSRKLITGCVSLSFLLSLPNVLWFGLHRVEIANNTWVKKCLFDDSFKAHKTYAAIYLVFLHIVLAVSLFVLLFSYTSIWVTLRGSTKRRLQLTGGENVDIGTSRVSTQHTTVSHKNTKTLFLITLIFVIVYLPYAVLGFVLVLVEDFKSNLSDTELALYRLAMRLTYVNNVVNCFVYGIIDSRFKAKVVTLYKRILRISSKGNKTQGRIYKISKKTTNCHTV